MEQMNHNEKQTIKKQSIFVACILFVIALILTYIFLSSPFIGGSKMMKSKAINSNFDSNIKAVIENAEPIYYPLPLEKKVKNPAVKIPILRYQEIVKVKPATEDASKIFVDDFTSQMKYLADNEYRTLTLEEFAAFQQGKIDIPKKSVVITFDYGYQSVYDVVEPILQEYNLHAISFITGIKAIEEPQNFIDTAEIEVLAPRNFLEFQSSGYNLFQKNEDGQGIIESISTDELIIDTKKEAAIIGKTTMFCYPFGQYGGTAKEKLTATGYIFGVTNETGYVSTKTDPLALPRIQMLANTTSEEFAKLLIP